jgi:hypothetical protein
MPKIIEHREIEYDFSFLLDGFSSLQCELGDIVNDPGSGASGVIIRIDYKDSRIPGDPTPQRSYVVRYYCKKVQVVT